MSKVVNKTAGTKFDSNKQYVDYELVNRYVSKSLSLSLRLMALANARGNVKVQSNKLSFKFIVSTSMWH